jgi:hypothetical protein
MPDGCTAQSPPLASVRLKTRDGVSIQGIADRRSRVHLPAAQWQHGHVWERPGGSEFDSLPEGVIGDLQARYERVPFDRIRRMADYYALREVEADYVRELALRAQLSVRDNELVESWWLSCLATQLSETLERLATERRDSAIRSLRRRRRVRSTVLFQLWFNTIGPGGRCWFGNRYTTIRHYTFRLRWRP